MVANTNIFEQLSYTLQQVKKRDEALWRTYQPSHAAGEICLFDDLVQPLQPQMGTVWQSYSATEIDAIEKMLGFALPWDYALYLKILGTPNKPCLSFELIDFDTVKIIEYEHYMDWRHPESTEKWLNAPFENLYLELEQHVQTPKWWQSAWGAFQKETAIVQLKAFIQTQHITQPLRVSGHRYLLSTPEDYPTGSVCLSMLGSDIMHWQLISELDAYFNDKHDLHEAAHHNLYTHSKAPLSFWSDFIREDLM